MATSLKRSRLIPARNSRAYRLEMEGRTLVLLVSLAALTGVVIFSLGVLTGMGMRVPATAIPVSTQAPPPPQQPAAPPKQGEGLAFSKALRAPESAIEGLKISEGKVSRQTRNLLKRAERELTLEEIPQAGAPRAAAPPSNPPAARTPAAAQSAEELYTVQVFSSRQPKSARDLMEKLKKQGFRAYMNQFQGSDRTTWYRVRVGKSDRAGAETLVRRLRNEANMKAPRIIRL